MEVFQSLFTKDQWQTPLPSVSDAQLLLVFGSKTHYSKCIEDTTLRSAFPNAEIIGCTTSGEILGTCCYDDSLCLTAITWTHTRLQLRSCHIQDFPDSQSAGAALAFKLDTTGLKHLLVFSDGQKVNGSRLVSGLSAVLPNTVSITGGLAGDGERFEETWVWYNEKIVSGMILVCGFYGDALQIGHGCVGGWDVFGPDRLVTKAEENLLFELDGESALALYKDYLGEHADNLPSSALLFPLHVHADNQQQGVVRTILNINESDQSMVFAGDIPEGSYAQLMHANFDRLVDGASAAAKNALSEIDNSEAAFAMLISCVGRRIVLNQQTEEELEAVEDVFKSEIPQCGFYSYGEISPLIAGSACSLHNQAMTITMFSEKQ